MNARQRLYAMASDLHIDADRMKAAREVALGFSGAHAAASVEFDARTKAKALEALADAWTIPAALDAMFRAGMEALASAPEVAPAQCWQCQRMRPCGCSAND